VSPREHEACPACGGAGGGPFGRAHSGWDIETYECPVCEGWGYIREVASAAGAERAPLPRPGIVKTAPDPRAGAGAGAGAAEATPSRRAR
jgi:hypothetical protein